MTTRLAISPTRAAELVGGRRRTALDWLRAEGLVREIPGLGERVVVRELEDRLSGVRPATSRPTRRLAERREGDAL